MVDPRSLHNGSPAQHLSVAFGIALAFVLVICACLEPRWHSNDDVALSMVAHGYGLNALSSPNLIFSNVVWGMLVQAIPWVGNTPGYSIATLGVLVICGAVIVMALARLGTGTAASIGILLLVLTRPVLFPQFTINAGLLAVAAVASLLVYARHRNCFCLFVACLLAFFSFLVRSLEFMFVMLASLPLIPWRQLSRDKWAFLGTAGLSLAIAGAVLADKQAFNSEHWQVFNELDPVRAQFTDFGAAIPLADSPKILERHNYSRNDINLIKNWFFADPQLVNPETLKSMLDELGPLPDPTRSLKNALAGIQALLHPHLLPLTLSSLLILMLHPCRKVIAAWMISLALFFALGLVGRPGVIRVFIPVLTLLLLAPLLLQQLQRHIETTSPRWARALLLALILATLWNTYAVVSESQTIGLRHKKVRDNLKNFPTEPVVVWGGSFPFEAVYGVLTVKQEPRSFKLYGLGVMTWAPYSHAAVEYHAGRGLVERIMSPEGIPFVASTSSLQLLAQYCEEHKDGVLQETKRETFGRVALSWRRCAPSPAQAR